VKPQNQFFPPNPLAAAPRHARARVAAGGLALAAALLVSTTALADKIKNPTAVFSGLDKITGRIISFEVAMDETVQFGSLQVTARVCYTRPPTEAPQTDTFVEVDEVSSDKDYKRIFSGWMYAASPGLHGIEHPIYDIWLTACKGGTDVIAEAPPATADAGGVPAVDPPPPDNATKPPPPNTPPPKPKRVVRSTPRPETPVAERRSPVQSFFPTTDYTNDDIAGRDLNGGRK
jgi:hypothetical protein